MSSLNLLRIFLTKFPNCNTTKSTKMKIRVVPLSNVEADNAELEPRPEGFTSERSLRQNTTSYTHTEIAEIIPETSFFLHAVPSCSPYDYTKWQPLVAKSQDIKEWHRSPIPPSLYHSLLLLHSSWVRTNKISESMVNDIVEDWTSTKPGQKLATILNGKKKWFIRFDQMSPKDSPSEKLPSLTFYNVISKNCTSMRTYRRLKDAQGRIEREGINPENQIDLALNLWDDTMDAATKFRVFVPPPPARGVIEPRINAFKISAISQYRWCAALNLPFESSVQWVADRVIKGADKTLTDIIAYMACDLPLYERVLLLKHGFIFDIALKEDEKLQLIEIKTFGEMSAYCACLFNWVPDARVLYGLEEARFAAVLEDEQKEAQALDGLDKTESVVVMEDEQKKVQVSDGLEETEIAVVMKDGQKEISEFEQMYRLLQREIERPKVIGFGASTASFNTD